MIPNKSLSLALGGFLLILVSGNALLFFLLVVPDKPQPHHGFSSSPLSSDIHNYLIHLSPQYKTINQKFGPILRQLIKSLNMSTEYLNMENLWQKLDFTDNGLTFASLGQILHAMKTSQIMLADNTQKGTQLKLLLLLEGKQKVFFKPKRYNIDHVINGNIYAGFDRHNSEVLGFYLAMVLNYKWVAPSVIRRVNIKNDILPIATTGLQKTMIKKGNGEWCIYGKCHYCKINETVCSDDHHTLEGAAIFYFDKQFKTNKSPWRRSYGKKKMEWETNDLYCKRVSSSVSLTRLLDLIDVSIFDFLIQNGDRHRYEVHRNKVILLDNGKGLGNPSIDELDILAPLYQCCMLRLTTWQRLEILSGGTLTHAIKTLSMLQGSILTTEEHYLAIERRLLKVYATVQMCIGIHGGAKVFK